ncbi:MAG TPA: DUF4124 domain-containing protein [Steroidobacteraceae bacterium]|nr:DUF4124 domain-containing protein [Steroidobacteraceae bacterium]
MSKRLTWVLTALALGALALSASATAGPNSKGGPVTYKWVDEHGVVHYGDQVPPQYSQQERQLLNREGVQVGAVAAPKTAAQAAEDERTQAAVLAQKQHDSFLLTTYTSVKDIEQLRDERLDQLHGQRVAAEQYVSSLHERLGTLQAHALEFKPYSDAPKARRMPDELAEDLVRTLNEIRSQRAALAAKDQEESATRAQFQADIDRYKELHVSAAAAAAR